MNDRILITLQLGQLRKNMMIDPATLDQATSPQMFIGCTLLPEIVKLRHAQRMAEGGNAKSGAEDLR